MSGQALEGAAAEPGARHKARSDTLVSGPPHSAHERPLRADRHGGYNRISVALHWLAALAMIVLTFLVGIEAIETHVRLGMIVAPLLVLHAIRRLLRGFPRPADEPALASLLARLTMIALLIAVPVLAMTGLALPAARGVPYTLFGAALPALPWSGDRALAALLGWVHLAAAATAFLALIAHLLVALSYSLRGLRSVIARIGTPVDRGR
ncbi:MULTISPECIES: cytochrome b/b6 domain-containing protein [unclassified Roseitalea]|uniref:cytochrome b/b6 domain-containing protein n=1 Tax=unclassified Roseitalea TaxID=2639107 RepID=UPI0027401E3E|nr:MULTISPECIES: cytochrome b/b6 domain-containing protein [unclassified Roseitalea]